LNDKRMTEIHTKYFESLKEFHEKCGLLPMFAEVYNNLPIGRWLQRSINLHSRNLLDPLLAKKLNTLVLDWTPDFWYDQYEELEGLLKAKQKVTGVLQDWLDLQAESLKKLNLPSEKITLLKKLKVDWQPFSGNTLKLMAIWHNRFECFKDYFEKHQQIPRQRPAEYDFDLAGWISSQRIAYNKELLAPEKVEKLNSVSPDWFKTQSEIHFEYRLIELKKHYKEHRRYPDSAGWLIELRCNYRQGMIPQARIDVLEKLPKWEWHPKQSAWDDSYNAVKDFIKVHNRLPMKEDIWKGHPVGLWLVSARSRYRIGSKRRFGTTYRKKELEMSLESI
jgi:hypothetical protein